MIPIYKPFLFGNEKKYVIDCLNSTWISSKGKYISLFENEIKSYCKRKYSSSCSNGTTALTLAFKALGIKKNDEVITSSFTYVASTNAILEQGAIPIFVDIEKKSWNIDVSLIEREITKNTKAILISNVYGFLPDIDYLLKICKKHKIFLIEDAAESFGARFKKHLSGGIGIISTLSFFGNKTLTTGEGGMVLTNNKKLYSKIESLKNQGNSSIQKYYHDILGYNYRMTNIQAAIGLAQFEQIEIILKRKKEIFQFYKQKIKSNVVFQKSIELNSAPSYWIVSVLFEKTDIKEKVEKALNKNGIETRPLFFPVDQLPFYKNDEKLVNTHSIFNKGICLPSYPSLTNKELNKIVKIINLTK
jgi:perosamine synthetase